MSRLAFVLPAVSLAASFLVYAQEPPKLRLPDDLRPIRYDLDLSLNPSIDTYTGKIGIDVEVKKATSVIWFHSTALKLTSGKVGSQTGRMLDGGKEFAGIGLGAPVQAGKTRVEIEFSGVFSKNDVEGLFKQSEAGNAYVFTQFEPTSARRAFPCFDEPALKVPWKVTVRVPKDIGAFGNTPVESETVEGSTKVVKFRQTKPMPSYLVALAVGPFDIVDGGTAGRNKIPVRAIVLKGRGAEAAYVNSVTPRIIAQLEEFFGMPYPYEKLDQVSIPITVGFGAMENAGLITYQQTTLLARPEDDTIWRQRGATSTITHEIAHQWFGNMVTPMWWDDIWLNEAFATWTANKIVGQINPDWNPQSSAVNSKQSVMTQDQYVSARKVRQPIAEHGDIGSAFDGITYQKGAAVIRMFENYVGADRFRKGVQNYMRKHMWGNATAGDFLDSISAAAGRDIRPAFSQFLDRGGLPLLTVEMKCAPGAQPKVTVSQERSLPLGSSGNRQEFWPTPVCLRWESDGKTGRKCVLVSDPKDEIALEGTKGCPTWLTANDQGTGYYHLVYKGDLGQRLAANSAKLSVPEKVDMLRNALALVKVGKIPAGDALGLAREFRKGPERELISATVDIVESVRRSVSAEARGNYAKMIREFYGDRAKQLGWSSKAGESADDRLLRPEVVALVGTHGQDPALAAQARELALKWTKNRDAVQADMVEVVLKVAAWNGDKALYESLLAEARKSKNRRERGRIIGAIGTFRDPAIAGTALDLMLTSDLDVRELTGLLRSFQQSSETERAPWEFVKANYDKLLPRLPSRLGVDAGAILPMSGASFCDETGYRQVKDFFEERIRTVSGGARALAMTLEAIQLCKARIPAQAPEVAQFLKNYAE